MRPWAHKKFSTLLAVTCLMGGNAFAADRDMARFVADKETLAREFAEAQPLKIPQQVWSLFDAIRVDDWETATNLFDRLQKLQPYATNIDSNSPNAGLQTVWPLAAEAFGTYEIFHDWNPKWLHRFGREVIDSVPKGGIYFGGTAVGRFIVSALSESHREGEPFFTLTQNQLSYGAYLEYLQKIYGKKIVLPTAEEAQQIYQEYLTDAGQRLKAGQLKRGEDVRVVNGRVQANGQVAAMELNGRLVRDIWKKNPGREFFVEESFPIDWMQPYLTPQGLIFKLNRTRLAKLDANTVAQNQALWKRVTGEAIGDWLDEKTSTADLCDFVIRIHAENNFKGFKGDLGFIHNPEVREAFAKLRVAGAGLYAWRGDNTRDEDERTRLKKAGDLAFRQAFAFCPYAPEVVYRYVQFLINQKRMDDALLVTKTSLRLKHDSQMAELARHLQQQ